MAAGDLKRAVGSELPRAWAVVRYLLAPMRRRALAELRVLVSGKQKRKRPP